MRIRRLLPLTALAVALALAPGCGDDSPTEPSGSTWTAVSLPDGLENGALFGVAFTGSDGIACGVQQVSNTLVPVLLGTDGTTWARILPSGVAEDMGLIAVDYDDAGHSVVVGYRGNAMELPGVDVLDRRSSDWMESEITDSGLPLSLEHGDGGFWCVGVADGGLFLYSDEADSWTRDTTVFDTPQEKGANDLAFRNGTFAAVGFDDHFESDDNFVVVNDGSGWTAVSGAPGADDPDVDFMAVEVTESGGLLVGGFRMEDGAPEAVLHQRSSDGDWATLTLPDPGAMRSVNRIHLAGNGDWFLLCGKGEGNVPGNGQVWRFNNVGWSREGTWASSDLTAITETDDGSLYIAGIRGSGPVPVPLLVRRDPPSN